jgi:isopentenyl phosphate kinase
MKDASMRTSLRTISANHKPMQSHVSGKKCWRSMTMFVAHFNNKAFPTVIHPPHHWAQGVGAEFEGDLARFNVRPGTVAVTFGDVVPVAGDAEFGILSGDDLVYRLATEVPYVERLVFAIGGVDGLLRCPP